MLAELLTDGGNRYAGEILERQASCDKRAGEVNCRSTRIKRSVNKSVT